MNRNAWEARWSSPQARAALEKTMLGTIGFELLELVPGRCVAAIAFRPGLAQPQGIFHAGAIVSLADTTASIAALTVTDPDATMAPGRFPLAVQISVNLVRNTDHGRITATADVIHGGRTTQVVETRINDEEGRLIALVTSTHVTVPVEQSRADSGGGTPALS
jgi:uncharacterized protein (TIGR00369 family)